jgi:hypothetical protein
MRLTKRRADPHPAPPRHARPHQPLKTPDQHRRTNPCALTTPPPYEAKGAVAGSLPTSRDHEHRNERGLRAGSAREHPVARQANGSHGRRGHSMPSLFAARSAHDALRGLLAPAAGGPAYSRTRVARRRFHSGRIVRAGARRARPPPTPRGGRAGRRAPGAATLLGAELRRAVQRWYRPSRRHDRLLSRKSSLQKLPARVPSGDTGRAASAP